MNAHSLAPLLGSALIIYGAGTVMSENTWRKNSNPTAQSTQKEAAQLWEQAIAAKGGRERLHRVRNMVISSRAEYGTHLGKRNSWNQEELDVFPNKKWHWSDMRPDVFGLRVEMYNYERRVFYISTPDAPEKETRQIPDYKTWERSTLLNDQVLYLMETSWVKPEPIAIYRSTVNGQTVDIVETQVFNERIDFALDSITHLPSRISYYNKSITGRGPLTISNVDLSDYVEVNEIKVPRKVKPENGSVFSTKIQMNVEFNEEIFTGPKAIEAGPEVWRPKK